MEKSVPVRPLRMKPVTFLGSSLDDLRDFPDDARTDCGYQLDKVQRGEQPDDFKPMATIGKGVEEIQVKDEKTSQKDIDLARSRFKDMMTLHDAAGKQQKGRHK